MFSVVISLFNKEGYIKNTLDSVFKQSFKDFEVIIVNDGSTDRSIEVVSTFTDKRLKILNKKNEGASTARNLGIQAAKYEFIALLDGDDIWYPNHLKNLKELIDNFPKCGLYCTAYETLYYNKKIVKGKFLEIDDSFNGIVSDYFTSSLVNSMASSSSVAIPKMIFKNYGKFDTNIRSGQDTEFWIKIALNENVAFTSNISARIIISDQGNHLSQSDKRNDRLMVLHRFKEDEENNASLKKYMDINRFSVAIERKMNKDKQSFRAIVRDIDLSNLNTKQKILLKLPRLALYSLKKFQEFLIKQKLYLTAFR